MKKGDTITIVVEAEIIETSNAHGECYQVRLAQRDYQEPREIWVDADEITTSPLWGDVLSSTRENLQANADAFKELSAEEQKEINDWIG